MPIGPTENIPLFPVDILLAIERIKVTKARYFRYIDTKQWDALSDVFTADCTIRFESDLAGVAPVREWLSAAAFIDVVRVRQADTVSVHHGFMPEITVSSATSAAAVWAMRDTVLRRDGADAPSFEGVGHYHDTYALVDGRWKISSMRLTRLYERVLDHLPGVRPAHRDVRVNAGQVDHVSGRLFKPKISETSSLISTPGTRR